MANDKSRTTNSIGFTGTRNGMKQAQEEIVARLLAGYAILHHGDCMGADAQAHGMAVNIGLRTESHPPIKIIMRAFCKADVSHPPKSYIARNHDIVNSTERLIATPAKMFEDNSGTWATIRFARRVGKPVTVVFPDGMIWHG